MRGLHDSAARWFCNFALVLGVSAAGVNLPPEWRHAQSFDVPAAGLLKISLPVETLDAARRESLSFRLSYGGSFNNFDFSLSQAVKVIDDAVDFRVGGGYLALQGDLLLRGLNGG